MQAFDEKVEENVQTEPAMLSLPNSQTILLQVRPDGTAVLQPSVQLADSYKEEETNAIAVAEQPSLDESKLEGFTFVTAPREGIQLFSLPNSELGATVGGRTFQLIPANSITASSDIISPLIVADDVSEGCQRLITLPDGCTLDAVAMQNAATVELVATGSGGMGSSGQLPILPPLEQRQLPPGCPGWAERLRDCEEVGDSYRGWVETEEELDYVLTMHKTLTCSTWGTRQSPSNSNPPKRLMWRSQHVPFDGIPFINSGARAVVMECQFGPRRKGASKRRINSCATHKFKQTCPARLYIKRVKKFLSHRIDPHQDKKALKIAMDKTFHELKVLTCDQLPNVQERFYVQLPTEKAHEFHGDTLTLIGGEIPHRLHPRVAQELRQLVAGGETRLYVIRKHLRRFVEKEFDSEAELAQIDKHDQRYYPTVNDLQNHIHQALKDIGQGILPKPDAKVSFRKEEDEELSDDIEVAASSFPHAEVVTVTLTTNTDNGEGHVISRVETKMSDGSTRTSSVLSAETAELLSKIHPNMFKSRTNNT